MASSQEKLSQAESDLRRLLDAYKASEANLNQTQTDYQAQQTKMFDLLDLLKEKKARQSSLEAILKNHSNFYAGVKAVLQHADQIGGIIGAVS